TAKFSCCRWMIASGFAQASAAARLLDRRARSAERRARRVTNCPRASRSALRAARRKAVHERHPGQQPQQPAAQLEHVSRGLGEGRERIADLVDTPAEVRQGLFLLL